MYFSNQDLTPNFCLVGFTKDEIHQINGRSLDLDLDLDLKFVKYLWIYLNKKSTLECIIHQGVN